MRPRIKVRNSSKSPIQIRANNNKCPDPYATQKSSETAEKPKSKRDPSTTNQNNKNPNPHVTHTTIRRRPIKAKHRT